MLIKVETRVDPSNLCKSFKNLGFNGFEYTKNKGFVGGNAMGWKKEKANDTILQKYFSIHTF